jgi:hypothetical protein
MEERGWEKLQGMTRNICNDMSDPRNDKNESGSFEIFPFS